MSRLIPIIFVIGIIIIGFISKLIELNKILKRSDSINSFRNRLIELLNELNDKNVLDQNLYYDLTMEVNSIQRELGADGIVHVQDNLRGYSVSNYQFLINFLPEIRNIQYERNNSIMMNRFDKSAKICDDMLIRHLGTLKESENTIRERLFNPFSCFADGIKTVISLPILILNWFGLISDEGTQRARKSWLLRVLNFIFVLLGAISAVITIVLGWNSFLELIQRAINSIQL